jgi:hypothetical protein
MEVWKEIWHQFFPDIHPMVIIFSSLLSIWCHHWSLVFDDVPFTSFSVFTTFGRLFQTALGESLIQL